MDFLSLLRMVGGLATVLGLLAGALWVVRRYDLKLPDRFLSGGDSKRLAVIERLPIDGRRSVALIRRDDREHLVLIAPEGLLMIESTTPDAAPRHGTRPPLHRKKLHA
jgi:flagellar protein FliO/FliZ